jgi:hypothetical protein
MVAVGGRIWTKAGIRESHRWVSALPTVLQIILVTSAGVRLQLPTLHNTGVRSPTLRGSHLSNDTDVVAKGKVRARPFQLLYMGIHGSRDTPCLNPIGLRVEQR